MMKWIVAAAIIAAVWMFLRKPRRPAMPAGERAARALLGVSPRAGADAIRAAHREQVAAAHPDRGGSADRTRQLNAARDLLLGRK